MSGHFGLLGFYSKYHTFVVELNIFYPRNLNPEHLFEGLNYEALPFGPTAQYDLGVGPTAKRHWYSWKLKLHGTSTKVSVTLLLHWYKENIQQVYFTGAVTLYTHKITF